jgi:molecular chaperone GrpE
MEENKTVQADEEMSAEAASRTESDGECVDEINEETCDGECDEKSSRGERKKLKKAEAQIAELEGELDEANDKYMRLYAEYENFRKRSQKEKEGTYADAYIDALTQILPILDNLERAAAYGTEDAEHPLAKGLELTLKSFEETMEKMGVKEIEALGAKFDPNLHNAVMHVDDDSFGENEVVEVFMKGYIRGDKVLRYSMVKVAN